MDASKSNYPKEWDAGISARYEGCELGTGAPTEYSKDQKHEKFFTHLNQGVCVP